MKGFCWASSMLIVGMCLKRLFRYCATVEGFSVFCVNVLATGFAIVVLGTSLASTTYLVVAWW